MRDVGPCGAEPSLGLRILQQPQFRILEAPAILGRDLELDREPFDRTEEGFAPRRACLTQVRDELLDAADDRLCDLAIDRLGDPPAPALRFGCRIKLVLTLLDKLTREVEQPIEYPLVKGIREKEGDCPAEQWRKLDFGKPAAERGGDELLKLAGVDGSEHMRHHADKAKSDGIGSCRQG